MPVLFLLSGPKLGATCCPDKREIWHGGADLRSAPCAKFYTGDHHTVTGTLAVDGWAVTFGTARRGPAGRTAAPPRPLLAVPNVTAHPSTASVPVTV